MGWGRRTTDDATTELEARLGPRERLLVSARTTTGELVGGSDRAFYLPDGVVLGWHEIDQAQWVLDDKRFDVVTLPIDGDARSYQVSLVDPGRFPELVRERVTSTIVVNQHVPLEGRRGVRIIARRVPGTTELDWIAVYDQGVDGSTDAVREHVRAAVAVLRTNLGV